MTSEFVRSENSVSSSLACEVRISISPSNAEARSEERPDWYPMKPTTATATTLVVSSIISSFDWMLKRGVQCRRGFLRMAIESRSLAGLGYEHSEHVESAVHSPRFLTGP